MFAMRIGVPSEIKDQENRVGATPEGVTRLIGAGHDVLVQEGAGLGSGFSDEQYSAAGARLVTAAEAWDTDLVLKIKEPLASEYGFLAGQILFTYLHLAGVAPELTDALLESGTTGVAYETVCDEAGKLPLLAPMSGVAGDMAPVVGSWFLARFNGGKGMLLGNVLGRSFGRVVILGDGVVGRHAARTAAGMGASVVLIGRHEERAPMLRAELGESVAYVLSTPANIAAQLVDADVFVGAVLSPGARAPVLVSSDMVDGMQPGSVIVDVSIDQGGCTETSRPTSHSQPVYETHGVLHYCVTNMPGAYPRASTIALTSATLPYAEALATGGLDALRADIGFGHGVNTFRGFVTCTAVADALELTDRHRPLKELL